MKKLLFYLLLLLSINKAFTQTVQGTIQDSTTHKLLQGAEVVLTSIPDSVQQGMYSDEEGKFLLSPVPNGKYLLKVQFIGYAPKNQLLNVNKELTEITIYLTEQALQGDSVKIVTTALEVIQKGDTTEFNANSKKLQGDATGEDLVKKMTGVVIDNEGVKVQGEVVNKVLVDGKPFFDNNPKTALSNLPARAIKKVQVYDEQNKLNPAEDKTKTMNIVLNPAMRIGTFGKANIGYGYQNKYIVGGNVNTFNGKRRVSFIGKSNNINEQGFGFEEIGEMLGANIFRQGGNTTVTTPSNMRGANAMDLMSGNYKQGVSTAHSVGFNFNDTWGKKFDVAATYFININDNIQQSNLTRQYLLGNKQTYTDVRTSKDYSLMHKISTRFTYNIDSLNTIEMQPSFSIGNGHSSALANTETSLSSLLLNATSNNTNGKSNNYTVGNNLEYNHNFRKERRNFSANVRGIYSYLESKSTFFSENIYYNDSTSIDSINQQTSTLGTTANYHANITYSEPISKTGIIRFQYSPSLNYRIADKSTYNYIPLEQQYTSLDSNLSNNYNSNYLTQSGSLMYRYQKEKLIVSIKGAIQYSTLSGQQFFPFRDEINRHFLNFLPDINLENSFKNKANLNLRYTTSTSAPDMSHLQNVIDNRNPLILSIGNPDLKQSYQHNFNIRYRHSNIEKNTSFFAVIRGDLQQNSIAYTTVFVPRDTVILEDYFVQQGVQIKKPINLNGNNGINFNVNQSFPLNKIKCRIEVGINGAYRKRPSLFNEILNQSYSSNIAPSFRINSDINDRIEFSLTANPSYAWVINSINTTQNTNYFNLNTNFNGNWVFYKQLFIGTNLTYQYYKGLSANYSPNYTLWNLTVGSKFGKKQQWKLSLFAFDLLNQNRSVNRTTAESYVEDKQSNVLSRYFMLSLAYNFNKFKADKTEAPKRER